MDPVLNASICDASTHTHINISVGQRAHFTYSLTSGPSHVRCDYGPDHTPVDKGPDHMSRPDHTHLLTKGPK